jgi:hypothetical protein
VDESEKERVKSLFLTLFWLLVCLTAQDTLGHMSETCSVSGYVSNSCLTHALVYHLSDTRDTDTEALVDMSCFLA